MTQNNPTKTLTTHVLDVANGRPAVGVPCHAEKYDLDKWQSFPMTTTNSDGRALNLIPPFDWTPGHYRLVFETGKYFPDGFYPVVTIEFCVKDSAHYHVPLLLSPFGYTTYRGS
ncbi:unnamed protein product [Didymodactylos carnosus]|uniref:5-hydroxyisourate hydrolase n=1 Tax=Didymodactylos carnosus TaxID=1234261 RepID=A0A815IN70_9BILA|nr:unnamed protein product [Didymodactylos carnosus]CAF1526820.1 unnamed protein product [Didymodactylos carnosus]CAF4251178.1 unnamed protein product [Didymodactylos carnosus]CAF4313544.1 unnamed protein product [Didymodactylos carnosus]